MRSDMHEVLIERPRGGLRLKTPRGNKPRVREWTGSEDDYARSYRPRQPRTKHFDDLLSPLRRWLRHQVGRPWDKVWSELCGGIDSRSVVGQHLLEHVRREVAVDCAYDPVRRRVVTKEQRRGHDLVDGLYVDPRHCLLCWKQPERRRRALVFLGEVSGDTRKVSPDRFQFRRNGIWFEAEVTPLPYAPRYRVEPHIRWFDGCYTIVRKRQLSSRELREHGLKNDA
ncbi:hypothetical protein [Tahibacter harae]|uniref:Uncharacterized protein n=1 Tax=Tahibacter harae TaxID=2963937 RepID=A0ABT1QU31_9GAMM|nr:hypothetical protein [Tahibacter harae]MCQ4165795.1 hypothetical protein [Tahibacter harae]